MADKCNTAATTTAAARATKRNENNNNDIGDDQNRERERQKVLIVNAMKCKHSPRAMPARSQEKDLFILCILCVQ